MLKLVVKHKWTVVILLTLAAFGLRTVAQFDSVFQGSFVNFQETDAWYHVRVVENLVRHFPSRIDVDPYMRLGDVQGVPTGQFYDLLLGGIAWVVGLGKPGEGLVTEIAAWYPALLGAMIVPVVFLLGETMFSVGAGLFGAAVIATLPGHFLAVSSLGFTDHHVMEALLSAVYVLALLRGRAVLAGLLLGAYLETFVGGAFFVAIVLAWAGYDRVRSLWPRGEGPFPVRDLLVSLLIAAAIVAPSYKQLWMRYSIASLLGGALGLWILDNWRQWCCERGRPRAVFFGGLAAAGLSLGVGSFLAAPGLWQAAGSIVPFFFPAYFGTTGAVAELQSLIFAPGKMTLLPAWKQFSGVYVLSVVGLFLLAEVTLKRPVKGASLLFFWGLITFLLAMGQIRMTYYFAVAAALLSGYVVVRIWESRPTGGEGRRAIWVLSVVLVCGLFVPNVATALEEGEQPRGISADWHQALDWLRNSTPEPFGNAAFYYSKYPRDYRAPREAYSLMAWWDYGYWIEAVARRVPVSNPTQVNAGLAASFFLAQTEDEAMVILRKAQARYVVINAELPLLSDANKTSGEYPDFFAWDRSKRLEDYFLVALEPAEDGKVAPRLMYRPNYYRSMAVRLFLHGPAGIEKPNGVAVAYFEKKQNSSGESYRVLGNLRRFDSYEEGVAAERQCQSEGCVLLGDNPQLSCVPLPPMRRFRQVFGSETRILGTGSNTRSAIQIYSLDFSDTELSTLNDFSH